VNLVQAVMGHEQASTTLNRYTHMLADTMPACGRR
jgi:site-specific recombinase XerD